MTKHRSYPWDTLSPEKREVLASWALKTYFNENCSDKPWFVPGLTQDKVLLEFSKPSSPISPPDLVSLWEVLPDLQETFRAMEIDKELDLVKEYLNRASKETPAHPRTQGDVPVAEVAQELGNITSTMVNKIFVRAAGKLRTLTGGVSPEDMDELDLLDMLDLIGNARKEAVDDYLFDLEASGGNILVFLHGLLEKRILTRRELPDVTPEEFEGLILLYSMSVEEAERVLLEDIEQEDNLFRTFQNTVSRKIFPYQKIGRKKQVKQPAEVVSREEPPVEELFSTTDEILDEDYDDDEEEDDYQPGDLMDQDTFGMEAPS